MANWSDLNPDLLSQIISRIKLPSDHIRISGVCSSWRSVALPHRYTLTHPIPGLILSLSPPNSHLRKFLNFHQNYSKQQQQHQQQPPFDCDQFHQMIINVPCSLRCCGSHKGWLVLTLDDQNSVFLFNPFIELHYKLPKLARKIVGKGVLSSPPSTETSKCVVLVLFETQGAAFCRIGDVSWTELQVFFYYEVGFCDALFFNGRFYVVDEHGKIYTCNLDDHFIDEISSQPLDVTKTRYKFYLVEIKDELCRILRKFTSCESFYYENAFDDDQNYGIATVGGGLDLTREFRVWKLDPGVKKWVRVYDLGEYALFLGMNNSICLSELEVCGIEGNKIYFTDDRQRNVKHFGFIRPGRDMGCYDMDDSSIEPLCFTQCEWNTDPPAIWVAPLPW